MYHMRKYKISRNITQPNMSHIFNEQKCELRKEKFLQIIQGQERRLKAIDHNLVVRPKLSAQVPYKQSCRVDHLQKRSYNVYYNVVDRARNVF